MSHFMYSMESVVYEMKGKQSSLHFLIFYI
jgi:hypothetical protein